jgi:hypothetical protein
MMPSRPHPNPLLEGQGKGLGAEPVTPMLLQGEGTDKGEEFVHADESHWLP